MQQGGQIYDTTAPQIALLANIFLSSFQVIYKVLQPRDWVSCRNDMAVQSVHDYQNHLQLQNEQHLNLINKRYLPILSDLIEESALGSCPLGNII